MVRAQRKGDVRVRRIIAMYIHHTPEKCTREPEMTHSRVQSLATGMTDTAAGEKVFALNAASQPSGGNGEVLTDGNYLGA